MWDLSTGRPLGPAFGNGALEMTFAPDGRRLAVLAPGHRGQVWDALRGVELLDVRDERAEGVTVSARRAAVLLDDGRFRLYEPAAARSGSGRSGLERSGLEQSGGARRLPAPAGGRGTPSPSAPTAAPSRSAAAGTSPSGTCPPAAATAPSWRAPPPSGSRTATAVASS
ncbi:hypothetical protein GCM10027612_43900 [Microbispora bryophytorum subsp. camponoti]